MFAILARGPSCKVPSVKARVRVAPCMKRSRNCVTFETIERSITKFGMIRRGVRSETCRAHIRASQSQRKEVRGAVEAEPEVSPSLPGGRRLSGPSAGALHESHGKDVVNRLV